ncbi:hypothetical protein ACFQU3_12160 [Terrabacter sp. GCM10028922]|uniref:glycoside hydrolase family 113 n=1 Tax=Terrabacter sp. GCM10028922 TaxID=3273428 RepID=UPI00361B0246
MQQIYGAAASDGPTADHPSTGASSAPSPGASSPTTTEAPTREVPSGASVPETRRVSALKWQNGIQVYLHEVAATREPDHTVGILDYVVSLGANSIGLSFPIYTDGARPTRVEGGAETPSPQRVKGIVEQAHERGLRVMLRPIIDEKNIAATKGEWRGSIRPVDTAAWFDSYADTISAYFGTDADEFVLAAELTSLKDEAREWAKLEARARKGFPGQLSYAFNWDAGLVKASHIDVFGLDLYFPIKLGDDATVAQLADGLRRAIEGQPAEVRERLVVQEVGIPALSGMYEIPWDWGSQGRVIKEEIQGNWFAAACQAVHEVEGRGIYYWMLDSNVDPLTVQPASQPAGSFIGRLGERSIKACFAR